MHTAGLTSQASRRHPGQPAAAGREPEKLDRYFRISAASTTAEHVRLVLLYQVGPVGLHRLRCRCWGSGWGKCRDRWCRLGNQGLTRDQRGSAGFFFAFSSSTPYLSACAVGDDGCLCARCAYTGTRTDTQPSATCMLQQRFRMPNTRTPRRGVDESPRRKRSRNGVFQKTLGHCVSGIGA